MFLRVSFGKQFLEMMLVSVTSQKGGWASSHENLGEFSVLLFCNIVKDLVVFLEIGLNKIKLLVSAPETWYLLLWFKNRVLWIEVSQVCPELCLKLRVRKSVFANFLDLMRLIWSIIFECLGLKSILLLNRETLRGAIWLNNCIFMLRCQRCLEFNTIDSYLATFNPRTS